MDADGVDPSDAGQAFGFEGLGEGREGLLWRRGGTSMAMKVRMESVIGL